MRPPAAFAHGERQGGGHKSDREEQVSDGREVSGRGERLTEILTPELAARAEAVWLSANQARLRALGMPPGPVAEQHDLIGLRLAAGAFGVVATDNDEVVAVALAMDAIEDDGSGNLPVPGLMHVSTIAVVPERWGQRLGQLVLADVLDEGRRRGYERAQLWTHETNLGAQRLYERIGWIASGRTKIDDHGEPIRQYVLELDQGAPPPRLNTTMAQRIFHIADANDWSRAAASGSYETSSRDLSLAEQGFIHASRLDQVGSVAQVVYADYREPLVLLTIDPSRLAAPVVDEDGGTGELFPHIYGPINVDAVTAVNRLRWDPAGRLVLPRTVID
jgi:uncharacterized protein (DUF952 family)/GNAT superfamily N-acetyltransferase